MIWVKEHAINKIPIIMSVRKFKIMRSRAKTVTMISFLWWEVVEGVRWIIFDLIEKVVISFFYKLGY